MDVSDKKVAVIGLGYVGMPLALALSKFNQVIGFDINEKRVEDLKNNIDSNGEIDSSVLRATACLFTDSETEIKDCDIYIITVPTPIDDNKQPDLGAVKAASELVGKCMKNGSIVVYESTVYPGVTEDICGPILERTSALQCGKEFFLGYSPERINPGDQEHTVENITKVVAGQNEEVSQLLAALYGQVNNNNIFVAANIKTAEASKAIENAQRDINVAFVNEITIIMNKLGLSALDVIEAASTKWNFLPFSPGLVGGHCIGVDPYYLAKSAIDVGYDPEIILAGRKTNDNMGQYIARVIDEYLRSQAELKTNLVNILVLGFTFKENINDVRNTKVIDFVRYLKEQGHNVDIHDPHALPEEVKHEYGVDILTTLPKDRKYEALSLMVPHKAYTEMNEITIQNMLRPSNGLKPYIFDMKGIWSKLKFDKNYHYQTL
jgi:UDP-N-acetyl-D-galactosamine dehydrogenase